jgi:hypothetical protein
VATSVVESGTVCAARTTLFTFSLSLIETRMTADQSIAELAVALRDARVASRKAGQAKALAITAMREAEAALLAALADKKGPVALPEVGLSVRIRTGSTRIPLSVPLVVAVVNKLFADDDYDGDPETYKAAIEVAKGTAVVTQSVSICRLKTRKAADELDTVPNPPKPHAADESKPEKARKPRPKSDSKAKRPKIS